ncbi:LADA_0H01222g1_1 [Lachancea dasiensis]|uniref:LADA_0H01222g1_1 n=1 Tax=Lachancea dasiensis TaxID=1072105 RepID=A0A1G4JZ45_9SACH|nr:LADA_0H01222g1_1 [Lachancea dasiensis]
MTTKYPTTMSCTEAFDQLSACYSVGGQFRNYYRYGEFNACSKQLEKFKFCILHGSDQVKVQQWFRDQADFNSKHRGSSDDIWEPKKV